MLYKKAIDEFVDYLDSRNYAEATLEDYKNDLLYLNNWLEREYNGPVYVGEVDLDDLESYLRYKIEVREVSPTTRNRALYIFRSFYSYLNKKDIRPNIAQKLEKIKEREKERDILTPEEMERVIDQIDKPHIKATTIFLYNTGCRIGEALSLFLSDIDFKNNRVLIREAKGNKDRKIPLNSKLKKSLKNYIENERPDVNTEYVFATERSGSLCRVYYSRELKKAVDKAGINKDISCHNIRHSTAVSLARANTPVHVIRDIYGHNSISSTNQYLSKELKDVELALEKL